MTQQVWRRTVKVEGPVEVPTHTLKSGAVIMAGTATLVTTDCGHVHQMNPTMLHRVGDLTRCYDCEEEAAEALIADEPRTTTDAASPTAEQRVAETQTGDAPVSKDLSPEAQAQYRRTYPQVPVAEAILKANHMPLDPGMPLSADNADAILSQPQARHIARLIAQVDENRADGGTLAQVATMAVRNLVSTTGTEWAALVAFYGIPTTRDWEMAQAAYGPTAGLPGLDR